MPSRFEGRSIGVTAWGAVAGRSTTIAMVLVSVMCLVGISSSGWAQSVVTYHNALDRSGFYAVPDLTAAVAANLHQDPAFHADVSGNIYAQPLYWQPSSAKTGLLIVATESNLVYALDADTGAQVWETELAPPVPKSTLPCGNLSPEGVTGTPVIDPASGTLYLDASTLQGGNLPRHMIYALSLANGKVRPHWPLNVDRAMAIRHVGFSSEVQGERSALQFFQDKLYISYAGRAGDCGLYRGAVIEVTPSIPPVLSGNWTTRAYRGGIWAQGGVTSDGTSLFVTTGNTAGADSWGDGEAVIRLHPGLAHSAEPRDYFTPQIWKILDHTDADLGGTAAVPLTVPRTRLRQAERILGLGKDGHAYLLDAANLGGIGHELKNMRISNSKIITAPAIYRTPAGTLVAFTDRSGVSAKCSGNSLTMLRITADEARPISIAWCAPLNGLGAPIITTTNGTADPIVWVTGAEGDDDLHGFDAVTGNVVFSGTGTSMTGLHRYGTPIAANRHLYVAADGTVYAFTF